MSSRLTPHRLITQQTNVCLSSHMPTSYLPLLLPLFRCRASHTRRWHLSHPPHIPSVIGIPQAQAQYAAGSAGGSVQGAGDRDLPGIIHVGGEWEREGLGRGLEERLEVLMTMPGKA